MTIEKKLDTLYAAVNKAWNDAFDGWEWMNMDDQSKRFLLGENCEDSNFTFYLGSNEDMFCGKLWIEYEPAKDLVELFIRYRPIAKKYMEDFKALFDKYSPFDMEVIFKRTTPVIIRKETVAPSDLQEFFTGFKRAFKENYPLFYLFTICEKEQYEDFCVCGEDC